MIRRIPSEGNKFALSFAQRRLFFLDQLIENKAVYNIPVAFRCRGELNVQALVDGFAEIVRRHEILRTTVHMVDGVVYQRINAAGPVSVPTIDLSHLDNDERDRALSYHTKDCTNNPFNLDQDLMLRACIIKMHAQEYHVVLCLHHIASDGLSFAVLLRELGVLYESRCRGVPSPLPTLPIQYVDYASWQIHQVDEGAFDKELTYWTRQLHGELTQLDVSTDRPRPRIQSYRGAIQSITLPADLITRVKSLGQSCGATLYMTLLAAFKVLLYRYTEKEDIVVGTTIANRTQVEIESLIGFFVNTLVIRTDLSGEPEFTSLLRQVCNNLLDAYDNQSLPFDKLVEELSPVRDISRNPLFQVLFNYNSGHLVDQSLYGLAVDEISVSTDTSKFDLEWMLVEADDQVTVRAIYNPDLFDDATISRLLKNYHTLLDHLVDDPIQSINKVPVLAADERQQILVNWNNTSVEYPQDLCVHAMFESQVERTPNAIALVFSNLRLSYRELNNCANQLAHQLITRGVGRGHFVPIIMKRSLDVPVAELAVMKTGAAFVPIDSEWPPARVKSVLNELNSPVVIANDAVAMQHGLPTDIIQNVNYRNKRQRTDNPLSDVSQDAALYAIYTSGSTGVPKGVINSHRGIVNRLLFANKLYACDEKEIALYSVVHYFDVSISQLLQPLINGARVIIPAMDNAFDLDHIIQLVHEEKVTSAFFVPSVFQIIVRHLEAHPQLRPNLASLKRLTLVGEAAVSHTTYLFKQWYPQTTVLNEYGPSETAILVTYFRLPDELIDTIPIGRPIDNVAALILDKSMQPVPVGVRGELYIGGDCVGSGYLNQPILTQAAFIPNPFPEVKCQTLYKSGDYARFLQNGDIDYLGRVDQQVKLRGMRIELDEIERVLNQQSSVHVSAVVMATSVNGDQQIIAYVVAAQTPTKATINVSAIKSHLRTKLPDYMVPVSIIELDQLPLSPSGKLDRRALKDTTEIPISSNDDHLGPLTTTEQTVASIWKQVLSLQQIGKHDSFFELGGHSLLATAITARLQEKFDVQVPLRVFFEHPTIAAIARYIDADSNVNQLESERSEAHIDDSGS